MEKTERVTAVIPKERKRQKSPAELTRRDFLVKIKRLTGLAFLASLGYGAWELAQANKLLEGLASSPDRPPDNPAKIEEARRKLPTLGLESQHLSYFGFSKELGEEAYINGVWLVGILIEKLKEPTGWWHFVVQRDHQSFDFMIPATDADAIKEVKDPLEKISIGEGITPFFAGAIGMQTEKDYRANGILFNYRDFRSPGRPGRGGDLLAESARLGDIMIMAVTTYYSGEYNDSLSRMFSPNTYSQFQEVLTKNNQAVQEVKAGMEKVRFDYPRIAFFIALE